VPENRRKEGGKVNAKSKRKGRGVSAEGVYSKPDGMDDEISLIAEYEDGFKHINILAIA
jgi:hypothetical protein